MSDRRGDEDDGRRNLDGGRRQLADSRRRRDRWNEDSSGERRPQWNDGEKKTGDIEMRGLDLRSRVLNRHCYMDDISQSNEASYLDNVSGDVHAHDVE